jgi:hypothetical protein
MLRVNWTSSALRTVQVLGKQVPFTTSDSSEQRWPRLHQQDTLTEIVVHHSAGLNLENRGVKIWPLSCHLMGWHQFRRKTGDKDMLVCQRCGQQELVWTKRCAIRPTAPGRSSMSSGLTAREDGS